MPKGLAVVEVSFECLCKYGFACVVGPPALAQKYVASRIGNETVLGQPVSDYGRGRFFFEKGCWPVIWIPRWPRLPDEYAALAHEIGHVLFAVFDHIGETADHQHDEVFCHMLSYGMKKVLEARPKGRI